MGGGWRVTGGGEVGGVADELERTSEGGNSAAAVGEATDGDKLSRPEARGSNGTDRRRGQRWDVGLTSGGGGVDPFRGMSKREKRKARRAEKEKREAERRLELAKAEIDAMLAPSTANDERVSQSSGW